MKVLNLGVVIITTLLFIGCDSTETNIHNNISDAVEKTVPHPIPNSSPASVDNEEFPPIAPII